MPQILPVTFEMTEAELRRVLEEFVGSPEVQQRTDPLAKQFDMLVAYCLHHGAVELAACVWSLVAFREAELEGDAAGLLLSRLAQISHEQGGVIREIIEEAEVFGRTPNLRAILTEALSPKPRACRKCGCTDDRACQGGCRWVEQDLCSVCATYPFPACRLCSTPAPHQAELAFANGWWEGVCPGCIRQGRADDLLPKGIHGEVRK